MGAIFSRAILSRGTLQVSNDKGTHFSAQYARLHPMDPVGKLLWAFMLLTIVPNGLLLFLPSYIGASDYA